MSDDILAQVVADLISSPAKFSLQLDETTDVSSLSQLVVIVCYMKDDAIKEDCLSCKPLTTTTKSMWRNSWMTSSDTTIFRWIWFLQFVRTELQPWWNDTLVLERWWNPMQNTSLLRTVLHRHALATKTLPPKPGRSIKLVVECELRAK